MRHGALVCPLGLFYEPWDSCVQLLSPVRAPLMRAPPTYAPLLTRICPPSFVRALLCVHAPLICVRPLLSMRALGLFYAL
jgi:hypothetical protein